MRRHNLKMTLDYHHPTLTNIIIYYVPGPYCTCTVKVPYFVETWQWCPYRALYLYYTV